MRLAVFLAAVLAAPALAQTQTTLYPGQSGAALLASIDTGYSPTQTLGYGPARDALYSYEDQSAQGLCGVYTQFCITLTPGADPSSDAINKGINAEHTWPQSLGAGSEPQRSDMHHLFPTRVDANGARGSYPLQDIDDAETDRWYRLAQNQTSVPSANLAEWSEVDGTNPASGFSGRFEPRDDHKGDAARAVFYFRAVYPSSAPQSFFDVMADDLIVWHYADPVSAEEAARSTWIAGQQGRENPFVLDSTLARRAYNLSTSTGGGGGGTDPVDGDIWVNELHYDNASGDTGEGIEIAGPAGTDLADVRLVLYNGSGSTVYDDRTLSGTIPDEGAGFGALWFGYPSNGIQNGDPDAFALVDADGTVLEFWSYEGTVTASGGPASGMTSTDLGVAETNSTPAGQSLQRVGEGRAGTDFTWTGPTGASPGLLNAGQTIAPGSAVIALRLVLQGAYETSLGGDALMRSDLEGVLPLGQPYGGAPWTHAGTEAISATDTDPANGVPDLLDAHAVVDWVLVSLRAAPDGAPVATAAALLLADGTLLDASGTPGVQIEAPAGSYHVVVHHRNHLPAMTGAPVAVGSGGAPLDLTTDAAAWLGGGVATLGARVGLVAGDGTADGSVLADDRQNSWLPAVGLTGYRTADFDLDGSVLAPDLQTMWSPNVGRETAVPNPAP